MPVGLSVSDIVNVGINLTPPAAQQRNFGTLLVVGSSPVIDAAQRIRQYATLSQVAADFGTTAPEYGAAVAFFSQSPQPSLLKIGRWAQTATAGVLHGAILPAALQVTTLAALQGITSGGLNVTIDGTARAVTGLNFSSAINLNGAASILNTALSAWATVTFDGTRFNITSNTTGAASSVGYATTAAGTDVAQTTGLSLAAGAAAPVGGIAAETAVACAQIMANQSQDWYTLYFAPITPLTTAQALLVAATIEGLSPTRTFGITVQDSATLDATQSSDLSSQLALSGYSRSLAQYSSLSPYAAASFFGKALSVNWAGSNTALTMKFKQEPGVIAETLTETQAAALTGKNCNVFVNYQNNTAIVQQGTVASGRFWDEVHGLDWLSNAIQTDLFNVLYVNATKIPQTDDGVHILVTSVERTLSQAVTNGLIAPGVWNAEGFGQLKRGDPLPKGFYVYAPLVQTQTQADRDARRAPVIQAAIKMAGAIHSASVIISINR